jgi:hypothetical protein
VCCPNREKVLLVVWLFRCLFSKVMFRVVIGPVLDVSWTLIWIRHASMRNAVVDMVVG